MVDRERYCFRLSAYNELAGVDDKFLVRWLPLPVDSLAAQGPTFTARPVSLHTHAPALLLCPQRRAH